MCAQSRHSWANEGTANDAGDEISMEQLQAAHQLQTTTHGDQTADVITKKRLGSKPHLRYLGHKMILFHEESTEPFVQTIYVKKNFRTTL